MEKKIIAVLVVLAIFSTSVFAAPVSLAASLPEPTQAVVSGEPTQEAPEASRSLKRDWRNRRLIRQRSFY